MAKPRKQFNSSEILLDKTGVVGATQWDLSVPEKTVVKVIHNFDFSPWYHRGIDEIVSACQQQITHWLTTHNGGYSIKTLHVCCNSGLKHFFDFLLEVRATTESQLKLAELDKTTIELFIQYSSHSGLSNTTQMNRYTHSKIVLKSLAQRGLIKQNIFPRNPYPNANKMKDSAIALSSRERKALAQALRQELENIVSNEGELKLNSYHLTACLLAVALRTGRNTTPLLNMDINCLRDHPLKEDRKLLVVYKRRGNKVHTVPLRDARQIEMMATVMPDVVTVIEKVIVLTAQYRNAVKGQQNGNIIWLFPSKDHREYGKIITLKDNNFKKNVKEFVERHKLQDADGNPLQINISRLRATFINRLWELSGNDPVITAKLGGHTLKVSNDYYLQATPEMQRNHKFLGDVLVQELLEKSLGNASDNTPVGKCRDSLNGDRAPKNGEHCTDYLSCFRCRSCVITGDDLYRLFSFYWLIIKERDAIGARNWGKVYAHIIRIIDRQVAPQFPADKVEDAKTQAKTNPHPFWRNRELLEAST